MPVKDVWLTPPTHRTPRIWALTSSLVIFAVSLCSKVWVGVFNKVRVHNVQRLHDVIDGRPAGKPLITVCNHYSMLDDNLLAYMCEWRTILDRDEFRWVPGAKNIIYNQYKYSLFFQLGRVVPVARGDGVYQQCMNFCVDELNKGKWVHLYPEGKVNMDQSCMRLKWGVGRLIADSNVAPLVLPYWHLGMDEVLANTKPYIPQAGKKVTVVIGQPIDFETIMKTLRTKGMNNEDLRKCITDRIQEEFWHLKQLAERLHYDHQAGIS